MLVKRILMVESEELVERRDLKGNGYARKERTFGKTSVVRSEGMKL
jgi:hypothetical protein